VNFGKVGANPGLTTRVIQLGLKLHILSRMATRFGALLLVFPLPAFRKRTGVLTATIRARCGTPRYGRSTRRTASG